jgi:AraC-like DNA-binding protein
MLQNFERYFEKNHEFETDYIKVLYYDLKKDYIGTYRSYDYNRVCTISEGIKNVRINNGESFEYTASEFILLPPNSSVEMIIKAETKAIVYEISDKLIDDTKEHLQNKYDLQVLIEDSNHINPYNLQPIQFPIARINDLLMSKDQNKSFLIDLYSQELAYNLIKDRLIKETYHNELHDPISFTIHHLKKNLTENIAISEIASLLNMSASNLTSHFKKQTGFTPKEYYTLLKLKESREILKIKTVSEVCYELGFENISYFISIFKKCYGETPKQFSLKSKQF